jgi:hypothetical protein
MKFKGIINVLVSIILLLSLALSAYSIFKNEDLGPTKFTSIHGEEVQIYGKGIYQNDSLSMAVQAKAQDIVTMLLGAPLLIISLYLIQRNSLKGQILLSGTLGYFLYTYTSYTFVAMYNHMFLIYITLMSLSFFAFILAMISIDIEKLPSRFHKRMPVKLIANFHLFLAITVTLLWLGRLVPPLLKGDVPLGLDHYTTFVIQGMDLGIVIPCQILGALLLLNRKPFGYLLSSVMTIKMITLLTALSAMIIGQSLSGDKVEITAMIIFPSFNLITIYIMVQIFKSIIDIKDGEEQL